MRATWAAVAVLAASVLAFSGTVAAADTFGPLPPADPYLGPMGTATMHGDAESSDSTMNHGPGAAGPVSARYTALAAACPTILQGADGYPQARCTAIADRSQSVRLLDPHTGGQLASLTLASSSLLGGVYGYLDNRDRMVVIDGNGNLLRIGHDQDGPGGTWRLFIASSTPLGPAIWGHCGQPGCDYANSLVADYTGRVWFATDNGAAGVFDPTTGSVHSIALNTGERIENSISVAPDGTAVATDHALYLLTAGGDAVPHVVWRRAYDRGPARKPGQLSWGTGATPTFFGPTSGTDYVTITDNAVPMENLLVYNTRSGDPVCAIPAVNGTENSPIGSGNSVFVSSTYGYPYPAYPPGAGPSEPASAPFNGGMTRIDVKPGGRGCTVKWTSAVRSAAVPRLSIGERRLYTTIRVPAPGSDGTSDADSYVYGVIDATTGAVGFQQLLGAGEGFDTLQMVGTIGPGQVQYQGTISGLFRISPG